MKICVIHLNQIGDLVFSLPLLKSLRDRYPDALIHSVVKPPLGELLRGSPLVDQVLPKPGRLAGKIRLARALRAQGYDLLICLARSEEALLLTGLSGARTRAGFARFPWDRALQVKEVVVGHNCWRNNACLIERLGIAPSVKGYVGLLPVESHECSAEVPENSVVISAGASPRRLVKAWDEEKFSRLAVRLHERSGLVPVLVGAGDTKESNGLIARGISTLARGRDIPVLDLTGRLGLRELTALLMRARLFVGIDSGVMHLASAVDIPVVALFGPTDPAFVGPQNVRSAVVRHEMPCMPCYLDTTCSGPVECMRRLQVDEVMDACAGLMDESGA
ncbi:MAG: glycosyltransferase family 9 protein [Deltaproteobacteria bacterium]|jgi:ADP-heptose:LPS heptosyltransferase|nr:glycosyltransferase family 9 protein [Deltaproteobacteria bacterium]MDX9761886.1 glycosyltransferase family 9 protein [Desulfomonilia bacterium]HPW67950.1 glycosyltransferase family 9 protein [Deltaproteobacteria bacterium]